MDAPVARGGTACLIQQNRRVMSPPYDRCIDLAVREIEAMADVCAGADPDRRVPSCPEWSLAELIEHTGAVHRWATQMVEQRSPVRIQRRGVDLGLPDDRDGYAGWLRDGARLFEQATRGADPDDGMWSWGTPKTVGFWPRRMIHETAIHRADAALAVGAAPTIDPEVAVDGIDELLGNLPHAAAFSPAVAGLRGDGEVLALAASDTGDAWRITLRADGFDWDRGGGDADGGLRTPSAADLLLTIYRRRSPGDGEVVGDAALVRRWLDGCVL